MANARIQAIEEKFWNNNTEFNLSAQCVAMADDPTEEIEVVHCDPKSGFKGYYKEDKFPKERIVLHFTVGNIRSDALALTDPKRGMVSTPFLLARDGRIYRLFPSGGWSYHLGRNSVGGNLAQSQATIGIEISNYGPLTLRDGKLETAYSRNGNPATGTSGKVDVYCTLEETDLYVKLEKPYRGYTYFASYTEEQYVSLVKLLRYLTAAYQIPREFLPVETRYETTTDMLEFGGIVSHVNYRTDKFDIGPAFDWDRVITELKAAPPIPKSRSLGPVGEDGPIVKSRSISAAPPEPEDEDFFKPIFEG
jgi:N-acetyl-anhydromuramyl-L-alanine amidase AmpD